jgi:hypothetical protein
MTTACSRPHGYTFVLVTSLLALTIRQGLIVGTPDEFTVNIDAPPGAKKAVVTAICRALAQQWFGALVSLAWWDTLYLVCVPSSSLHILTTL